MDAFIDSYEQDPSNWRKGVAEMTDLKEEISKYWSRFAVTQEKSKIAKEA